MTEDVTKFIYDAIEKRFPGITPEMCLQVLCSLFSTGRGEKEIALYLKNSTNTSPESIIDDLFQDNLKYFQEKFNNTTATIVGLFHDRTYFHDHLTPLTTVFTEDKGYHCTNIMTPYYVESTSLKHISELTPSLLYVPKEEYLRQVDFLTCVFIIDIVYCKPLFPKSVKKISINHQTDGSFRNNVREMAQYCSYLICASVEDYANGYGEDYLADMYPPFLLNHSDNFICAVPAGQPKLCYLHEKTNLFTGSNKIIYHLTRLTKVLNAAHVVPTTLDILTKTFPDKQILMRCVQEDLRSEFLQQLIVKYRSLPNFIIDEATSYIDSYSDGEILVSHHHQDATSFVWASGIPHVVFEQENKGEIERLGQGSFKVYSSDQLAHCIRLIYDNYKHVVDSNFALNQQKMWRIRDGLQYLERNFHYILTNKPHPEWTYFPISREQNAKSSPETQLIVALQKALRVAKRKDLKVHPNAVINFAADNYPENSDIQFLATAIFAEYFNDFGFVNTLYCLTYVKTLKALWGIVRNNKNHPHFEFTRKQITDFGIPILLFLMQNAKKEGMEDFAYYKSMNLTGVFVESSDTLQTFLPTLEDPQYFWKLGKRR